MASSSGSSGGINMATLTADALAGNNSCIQNAEATWAAAIGGGGEGTSSYIVVADRIAADNWSCSRTFLWFDTSSLGAGATISAAKLVHPLIANVGNTDNLTIHVVGHTAADTTIVAGDYDTIGSTSYGNVAVSGLSEATTTDITLNATAIAAISKTGNTAIGIRSNKDKDAVEPTTSNGYTANRANFDLVITYTPAPSSSFFAMF